MDLERRRSATPAEVDDAIGALDGLPRRVRARDWPCDLVDLNGPGLYSLWVDSEGAAMLAAGLELQLPAGRIYAGLTGATKWPSGTTGKATLRSRIGQNHLRGQVRGSTFRLTLAAVLQEPLRLHVATPKQLVPGSERELSEWIADHLEVAVHPFPNADALADLEHLVLHRLDPPLNLDAMPPTPIRLRIAELRRTLLRSHSN